MRKGLLSPSGQGDHIYIGLETEHRGEVKCLNYNDFINGNYHPVELYLDDKRRKIPRLDEWIERFPNIEVLSLSRDLIPFRKINLDNLKSFILCNFCDEKLSKKAHKHLWLKEQVMPNVKFYLNVEYQDIFDIGGIRFENLPNLEWLECRLDNKEKMIEIIYEFETLTSLDLSDVTNQDVFSAFRDKLRILALTGASKKFPMKKIRNQTNLEIVYVNGYKSTFDMEWLLDLKLKEIHLISCPTVVNSECLLQMDYLESIYILDCKKALSKELKSRLKERNFKYLNIDYT